MSKPLVSICVPTYNGQEFLRQCLESCLNQTYPDYEVLVCDDGSSDNTILIIEEYLKQHPKLSLIKNPVNLGLVGNWNKCLQEAKGEWIKFVFQDDYISNNCLETFVKAIENDVVLLVSERDYLLPANVAADIKNYYSNVVRTLVNTVKQPQSIYPPKQISNLAVQNMAMNFIAEPGLSFFKRDLIISAGTFNNAFKQICDLEFLLRIASQHGLKYVPEKICHFRIHKNTTTQSNVAKNYYTLHYIEPLLFAWHLLYHPQFKTLRGYLQFYHRLKLNLYFKVKAIKAYKACLGNVEAQLIFNQAQTDFKEIEAAKNGNWFTGLIAKLL